MNIHKVGTPENPATRRDVADKLDEIAEQREKEKTDTKKFNVGIAIVGDTGDETLSEKSKLVVTSSSLPDSDSVIVSTTFRSGDKESLKSQLHKIVNDLVDTL